MSTKSYLIILDYVDEITSRDKKIIISEGGIRTTIQETITSIQADHFQ